MSYAGYTKQGFAVPGAAIGTKRAGQSAEEMQRYASSWWASLLGWCCLFGLLVAAVVVSSVTLSKVSHFIADSVDGKAVSVNEAGIAALEQHMTSSAAAMDAAIAAIQAQSSTVGAQSVDTSALESLVDEARTTLAATRAATRRQRLAWDRYHHHHDSSSSSSSSSDDDDDIFGDKCLELLSISKFGLEKGTTVAGKNVLIIGASRGVGCGAAQQFAKHGANVVGTSRAPGIYPLAVPTGVYPVCVDENDVSLVSDTPLRLENQTSIVNFFDNDPTVSSWDHIDYLILGGIGSSQGMVGVTTDAFDDMFAFYHPEMIGRISVLQRASQKMNLADDPRAIFLTSTASFTSSVPFGGYLSTKAAESSFAKQWNSVVSWIKLINRPVPGDGRNRIRLMAFEANFVNSSIGKTGTSLQTAGVMPFVNYGGSCVQSSLYLNATAVAFFTSLNGGMTINTAGDALVYMATTHSKETRFYVPSGQTVCIDDCDGTCSRYGSDAQSVCLATGQTSFGRDAFNSRLLAASIYNNMIALATANFSALVGFNNVCPRDMTYKIPANPLDVPAFAKFPALDANMCCAAPVAPQYTQTSWLDKIEDDPCKAGGQNQVPIAPSSLPLANHGATGFELAAEIFAGMSAA